MGVRLFVPRLENIQLEEAPPADPFSAPVLSLNRLFQFSPLRRLEHRVKILATLTHQDSQAGRLYLQAGGDGVVAYTAQPTHLAIGSRVEVVGFVAPGEYPAKLQDSIFRKVGEGKPLAPVTIRAADAIQQKDGFIFAPYSGLLIRTEGQLVEKIQRPAQQVWLIREANHIFRASIDDGVEAQRLAYVGIGSRVQVTGICAVEMDQTLQPQSFSILLRSSADIAVLAAPWWNLEKSLWLIGILVIVCLSMLGWILQVRNAHWRFAQDRPDEAADLAPIFRTVSRLAGLLGGAIGTLGLAGSVLRIDRLRSLVPGYSVMAPNTALGLLLAGLAVWTFGRRSVGWRLISRFSAALAALIGMLTFGEYVSGINLRIDELLFRDLTSSSGVFPGRMPPVTAFVFALLGSSLLLLSRKRWMTGQTLACAAAALSFLNLVSQLYGVKAGYELASSIGMAIPTSIGFVVLCAGILFVRPDRGLIAIVTSPAPGGHMSRRLLPAAIFVPTVLGWMGWLGQLHGLYNAAFGLALFASANSSRWHA